MKQKTENESLDAILKKLEAAEKEFDQKMKAADLGTLIKQEEERKNAD
jgi:hypothetical protein